MELVWEDFQQTTDAIFGWVLRTMRSKLVKQDRNYYLNVDDIQPEMVVMAGKMDFWFHSWLMARQN